jgi:hypothetical protein
VHLTTDFSHFEAIYRFNPLTFINLIHFPIKEMISLDGENKVKNGETTS